MGKDVLEQYRTLVLADIRKVGSMTAKCSKIEKEFVPLVKNVLGIIGLLDHTDFREFFEDLIEKVRDPCKRLELGKKDAIVLFRHLIASFDPLVLRECTGTSKSQYSMVWTRFIGALSECLMTVYLL